MGNTTIGLGGASQRGTGAPRKGVGVAAVLAAVVAAAFTAAAFAVHHTWPDLRVPQAWVRVPATKVAALMLFAALFVPLERLFALRQQPVLRRGWRADVLYFWLNSVFATGGTLLAIAVVGIELRFLVPGAARHAIGSQPAVLQFVEALFLSEIGEYWAHRTMHTVPWLWRFHQVHHGVEHMDWLASARLHPVDRAFTRSAAFLPLFVLGFSNVTVGAFALFAALQSLATHANVRFDFGPLRYVIVTPQYHHWHHSAEVHDTNFAAQLPIVDWMFRSLHLPAHRWPEAYGTDEDIPTEYVASIVWPFRRLRRRCVATYR